VTVASFRDRRLSTVAFALCAFACAALFLALLSEKCRICSASPWGLPFGGAAVWTAIAWMTSVNPRIVWLGGALAMVTHASLVLAEGRVPAPSV
jgi:hypothetical protein